MSRYFKGQKAVSNAYSAVLVGESSGVRAASALIYTGLVLILGIKCKTDGANPVQLDIYDNLSASGEKWDEWLIPAADRYGGGFYPAPMHMANGIYVAASGGSFTYTVFFGEVFDLGLRDQPI